MRGSTRTTLALTLLAAALAASAPPLGCSPIERDFSATGASSGTGGATETCDPGTETACYDGPKDTENVGLCEPGTHICKADGASYSECAGQILPAAEDCTTPDDEDCDGLAPKCPLDTYWARAFEAGAAFFPPIAADPSGNLLFAGSFSNPIDFGSGPLTSAGSIDIFVAKFDPAGNTLWSRSYGDAMNQAATSIAVDPSGNVYVTGIFEGTVDFGGGYSFTSAGGNDAFVLKLAPDGQTLWAATGGDAEDQTPSHIAVAPDGAAVIAGRLQGSISFGGGPSAAAPLATNSLFVAKLSPEGLGVATQATAETGSASEELLALAISPTGDVFLGGDFDGTISFGPLMYTGVSPERDGFYFKLDGATLEPLWGGTYGMTGLNGTLGIVPTASNEVWLTGTIEGPAMFGSYQLVPPTLASFFLVKLNSAGDVISAQQYGDLDNQGITGIILARGNSKGGLVLAGTFGGTLDFGGGPITTVGPMGDSDGYVAELDSQGNVVATRQFGGMDTQAFLGLSVGGNDDIFAAMVIQGEFDFGTGPVGANDMVTRTALVKLAP